MKLHKEKLAYPDTEHYYYADEPVYRRYKTVKELVYCDSCGQIKGYYDKEVGVGLLGYKKVKRKKGSFYLMNKVMEEQLTPKVVDSILGK